jgi:hypothetical protein
VVFPVQIKYIVSFGGLILPFNKFIKVLGDFDSYFLDVSVPISNFYQAVSKLFSDLDEIFNIGFCFQEWCMGVL